MAGPNKSFGSMSTEDASISGESYAPSVQEAGEPNVSSFYERYGDQNGLTLKSGSRFGGQLLYTPTSNFSTTSTSYVTQKLQNTHPIYHPPGTVPVVILTGRIWNDTAGEKTYLRFDFTTGIENTDQMVIDAAATSPNANAENAFIKEMYLADPYEQHGTGRKKRLPQYRLQQKVSAGGGYIGEDFQARIFYEVI